MRFRKIRQNFFINFHGVNSVCPRIRRRLWGKFINGGESKSTLNKLLWTNYIKKLLLLVWNIFRSNYGDEE